MAFHTFEYDDHYVIAPAIKFYHTDNNYKTNAIGEVGKPVEEGFEYISGANEQFLSMDEIKWLNREANW